MSETITKAEIANQLYEKIGISKREAFKFLESTIDIMKETLVDGEKVKISGFGTFSVKAKNQRKGRNPQTGDELILPARKVLLFKPSQVVRDKINTNSK